VGPQACGNPFVNHFGPYDYRTAPPGIRKVVEDVHFTRGIETITQPKNTMFQEMAQDVEYTLNVFPNHARALLTMSRLVDRWRRDPAPGTRLPLECWFDRAVRFRPDDTVVRSLYAQFLHRRKRTDEGIAQLRIAIGHASDNGLSHYNIGLVAMELGDHALALQQAHRALALGFPRPELSAQLKALQQWREPSDMAAAPANAAASTPASPTQAPQ
jgi:tetratricopeptide (TPR) repeat protein